MGVHAGSGVRPGTEVAGFRVETLIGRGGMGAVYRAEDVRLGRKVALKVLIPELAGDTRFRDRFLRESRLAASLDHPHVVPILEAGEAEGLLFIAMRHVDGTDLGKLIAEEGALEPERAVGLVEQAAEALDAAHEQGLVHRDVKPSNVLIGRSGGKEHCYLADFGLTKQASSISGLTATGQLIGTLDYVAPEQITGETVDARSDVYSLGCVLYQCLTGVPPFDKGTEMAVLWGHVHEEAPAPSERQAVLPRAFDTVLARALAKEPERRYATCGELAAAARAAIAPAEATPTPTRWRTAVAAVAVAAAVGALASFLVLGGDSGGLAAISPNAVGIVDPATNRLVGEVAVGVDPESIAVGEGGVWVANVEDGTLSRIDPATRRLVRGAIALDEYPSDVTVGEGSVWAALGVVGSVQRIDVDRNERARRIGALGENGFCGGPRASVAVGAGAVWFACESADLGRVDVATGKGARVGYEAGLLTSASSVVPLFADIAFGLGSLWIVNRAGNSVSEVDPATSRRVREITVGRAPTAVAVGTGAVWVTSSEDDTLTRIDVPGRGQPVATQAIVVGDRPVDVAVGEDGIWVANAGDRTISRVDPETGEVTATIRVGSEPRRVAAGGGAVWVTAGMTEAP